MDIHSRKEKRLQVVLSLRCGSPGPHGFWKLQSTLTIQRPSLDLRTLLSSDEYCRCMSQHAFDFIGRNAYTFMNFHVEPHGCSELQGLPRRFKSCAPQVMISMLPNVACQQGATQTGYSKGFNLHQERRE